MLSGFSMCALDWQNLFSGLIDANIRYSFMGLFAYSQTFDSINQIGRKLSYFGVSESSVMMNESAIMSHHTCMKKNKLLGKRWEVQIQSGNWDKCSSRPEAELMQECFLGPVLFNMYTYDLPNCMVNSIQYGTQMPATCLMIHRRLTWPLYKSMLTFKIS